MSNFISNTVDLVWGPQLVALLFLGGVYLFIISGGRALLRIKLAIKLIFGKSDFGKQNSIGQLSHFQALTNALAATIGLGNIAGVAVAITQGGPGALFWMWISGLVGMNTKFFESTLSIMFRGKDSFGEVQGGPMYYLPKVIKGYTGKALAVFFAIAGLIGTQALFQANQLAAFMNEEVLVPKAVTGVFISVFAGVTLMGGLKRIARVTSTVVPFMCVLYVIMSLAVIALNLPKVPGVFYLIFREAFSFESMGGGVMGYAIIHAFQIGIKRGVFSNEAGVGTSPMAHGNAKTSEPLSEGLVAMVGPLLDTMIVCTMTALVILITVDISSLDTAAVQGVRLTTDAFNSQFGAVGTWALGLCVVFFSLSTVVGMSNYNEKCWLFLFREKKFFKRNTFIVFFCTFLFFGAVVQVEDAVNILDIGFGLMAYPNMLAVLVAAPIVVKELKSKLF